MRGEPERNPACDGVAVQHAQRLDAGHGLRCLLLRQQQRQVSLRSEHTESTVWFRRGDSPVTKQTPTFRCVGGLLVHHVRGRAHPPATGADREVNAEDNAGAAFMTPL